MYFCGPAQRSSDRNWNTASITYTRRTEQQFSCVQLLPATKNQHKTYNVPFLKSYVADQQRMKQVCDFCWHCQCFEFPSVHDVGRTKGTISDQQNMLNYYHKRSLFGVPGSTWSTVTLKKRWVNQNLKVVEVMSQKFLCILCTMTAILTAIMHVKLSQLVTRVKN